jgi:hypothetical protein
MNDAPRDESSPVLSLSFSRREVFNLAVILGTALLVRVLFLLMKPFDAVSNDILYWEEVSAKLAAGLNPYTESTRLNWPPFWMQIVFFLGKISDGSGMPLRIVVYTFLLMVEMCALAATYLFLASAKFGATRSLLICAWSLNPAFVLLTCQHGNFDVIVGLFVLLAVWSFLSFHHRTGRIEEWLAFCFLTGMGILAKTVPVVLIPLFAHRIKQVPVIGRILGALLIFGPVTLGMSILISLGEEGVGRNVIQYRSVPFDFGVVGAIKAFLGERAVHHYASLFYLILLSGMVGVSVLVRERASIRPFDTVLIAAVSLALIPWIGPGYGTQYLFWFAPLLIVSWALGDRQWRTLLAAFYLVLIPTYLCTYLFLEPYGNLAGRLGVTGGGFLDYIGGNLFHLPLFLLYTMVIISAMLRVIGLASFRLPRG